MHMANAPGAPTAAPFSPGSPDPGVGQLCNFDKLLLEAFIIYHCSKMPNDVVADHSFSRACLAGPLPLALTLTRVTGVQSLHKTVRRPVAYS